MQHILLYHKAMNSLTKQHRTFYQLESIAMQFAQANLSTLNQQCVVFSDNPNNIVKTLLNHEGCPLSVDSQNYHYLIEELPDFPCLVIKHQNMKYSSHHRRVSILLTAQNQNAAALLQIRQINAINLLDCMSTEQQVKPGISSWRYLSELNIP